MSRATDLGEFPTSYLGADYPDGNFGKFLSITTTSSYLGADYPDSNFGAMLVNNIDAGYFGQDYANGNYGATALREIEAVYLGLDYMSGNWGSITVNSTRSSAYFDVEPVYGFNRTQNIYWMLRGFNSNTSQYVCWTISRQYTTTPVSYDQNTVPNFINGVWVTDGYSDGYTDVVILYSYIQ